ncbi:hypothetical protein EX30DRAFT_81885 [Ascodesmis nigricans]|uniref:Uncharacterized protein n=1 Tax=Ascodesmis nigricans TaxID=341454 RepID=A0A4S2N340_9PEZI|nr:hypothetical protein EX30DRAFT_81885 [Ascodesmis nigricans]
MVGKRECDSAHRCKSSFPWLSCCCAVCCASLSSVVALLPCLYPPAVVVHINTLFKARQTGTIVNPPRRQDWGELTPNVNVIGVKLPFFLSALLAYRIQSEVARSVVRACWLAGWRGYVPAVVAVVESTAG